MKPWMWSGIWYLVLFGGGFWLGILYKGRKISKIVSVFKEDGLSTGDIVRKISDIVT